MTSVAGRALHAVGSLVVLLLAVLLAAHDATWSVIVALLLAAVGMVLLRRVAPGGGRWGLVAVFVACALVVFGGSQTVRAGWLHVFGRVSAATVTHVSSHCTGRSVCHRVEDYDVRLPDGTAVDGHLGDYQPGAFHVGSPVTVRYDPSGLVQAPVSVFSTGHRHDLVIGPVLFVAGVLLAGGLAAGVSGPSRRQRSNL